MAGTSRNTAANRDYVASGFAHSSEQVGAAMHSTESKRLEWAKACREATKYRPPSCPERIKLLRASIGRPRFVNARDDT